MSYYDDSEYEQIAYESQNRLIFGDVSTFYQRIEQIIEYNHLGFMKKSYFYRWSRNKI